MPTLTNTLQDLINLAQKSVGTDIHTKLAHGLHIWIHYNGTDKFRLAIGRQKVVPSFQEWNTCCANWPYSVKVPTPARSQDEHGINNFLIGYLPAPTVNDADGQTPPHIS